MTPPAKKPLFPVAIVALSVALAASAAGNAVQYFKLGAARRQMAAAQADPSKKAAEENAQLVARIAKLMVLPDEAPTIATVTDLSKLKNQPFFADAKTGDKVLIYAQAKKAILYDPGADKIVNVAPVNMTGDQATAAPPAPEAVKGEDPKPARKKTTAPPGEQPAAQ